MLSFGEINLVCMRTPSWSVREEAAMHVVFCRISRCAGLLLNIALPSDSSGHWYVNVSVLYTAKYSVSLSRKSKNKEKKSREMAAI